MNLTTRALIAVIAVTGFVGLVGAYLGAAALQDDSPDEPVVQSTKEGEDPNEPLNDPGVDPPPEITRGVEVTPRPCPECFVGLPEPAPGSPCPQRSTGDTLVPDFESLAAAPKNDWPEYRSPNYEFAFRYPPAWTLDVTYNDIYGWPDGRVQGPVTEMIRLYSPLWAAMLEKGDPRSVPPVSAAKIEMNYAPALASEGCTGTSDGNPRRLEIQIAGRTTFAGISVVEGSDVVPPTYLFGAGVNLEDSKQFVLLAYSAGDDSGLSAAKAVLGSVWLGDR